MNKERKLAYLALLATAILWGIAPPIIKYTFSFITPFSFLFYRFLIAFGLVFFPFILRLKKFKPGKKDLGSYFFLAFLCAPLNLGLLFLGIQRTTAIDASLISIISPVLIILGGAFFLKEQVTKNERIGIGLALSGTFLTIIQPMLERKADIGPNIIGNLLVLLGTFSWVVFSLLIKKKHRLDPFLLTCFSYLVGLICVFPFFLIEKASLSSLALPGILYMAIFCSVFANFFYVFGFSKIEASEATVFTYLQPVFSVPLSVLLLNEKITPAFVFGATLIMLGVFICELRLPARH